MLRCVYEQSPTDERNFSQIKTGSSYGLRRFFTVIQGFAYLMLTQNKRFEFIDGMRGIAALMVVFFHLNIAIQNHSGGAIPYFLNQLLFHGYLGIQIFFVLSGFVIAYSLRRISMNVSFLVNFFVRRSIRLDPPYWIMILLTLSFAWFANSTFKSHLEFPFTAIQIFYNLFYLPDLMQVPLIIPVAWTLCIEFQFYIFFALLIMLFQHVKTPYALCVWTLVFIFSLLQNTPLAILPLKPVTFIPHWYSFFLGCATCWAMLRKIPIKFLFFLYLIVAICSFWTSSPHAMTSLAVALLIYLVSLKDGLHQVLKHSFFQYMGKISYSLYLIHWLVGMKLIDLGYKIANNELEYPIFLFSLWIVALLLTILSADIFYRIIERPSHHLSRQLSTKISEEKKQDEFVKDIRLLDNKEFLSS